MVQILELFGGIGSPRCALRNIGIPVKAIDYVEIDEKAVRSYNAMFANELEYKTQSVVGWNLKPDILIHGSPCQDFSIAGHQKGADEGSETRSSLMWETIHIIEQMGEWKPKYVIWENVKNVRSKLKDTPKEYDVTQPSVLNVIGNKGIKRATVIKDFAYTITTRQDRTPAQVIDMGNGRYRYLTELECWRLQGYNDSDFYAAAAVHKRKGRYTMPLYKQAGNSIPVTIFESMFRKILLGETENGRQ